MSWQHEHTICIVSIGSSLLNLVYLLHFLASVSNASSKPSPGYYNVFSRHAGQFLFQVYIRKDFERNAHDIMSWKKRQVLKTPLQFETYSEWLHSEIVHPLSMTSNSYILRLFSTRSNILLSSFQYITILLRQLTEYRELYLSKNNSINSTYNDSFLSGWWKSLNGMA
jgi:hypothetical protein